MTKLENFISKKKLIIFDLDGVIINSINTMRIAWNYASKKNNLKNSFSEYSKYIGLPFKKILKNLKIKSAHEKIRKDFGFMSRKKINKTKLYPKAKFVLEQLKKNGKAVVLLTSKDEGRTKKIIKFFKIKFDHVACGDKTKKGKPYPFQILGILNKLKFKKSETVYIGDTSYDYLTCKNAKIDFIFAKYGYGKVGRNIKFIKKLTQLV